VSRFRVRVWCDACRGDVEGCFGGSSELMPKYFATSEEARRAAIEYCGSWPYSYVVEECEEEALSLIPAPTDADNATGSRFA
jgi:hypothetical protein